MKKINLLILFLALSTFAFAQTPFSLTGASAATNFNGGSLDNGTGSSLSTFPAGWGLAELGGGSSANGFYRAGTGSSNAGDARSFGAASTQERAFGGVASNSVQAILGFAFTNNTGNSITQMNVSYTGEQWRAGDTSSLVDSLLFEYSLNATSTNDSSATWTSVQALNFLSPNPTGGASTGALDGNNASNQGALSSNIMATVANSATVYFRWRDINIVGSDDGLSIDDFVMTVTTTGGPLPPALVSTMPADNATNVPVSTTSMTITLDNNIMMFGNGSGATLVNITNSSSVSIPMANISFSGMTATLSGVTLVSNTDYAVQIDSNVLQTNNGTYPGIYDNTTWNFKTQNTTPPPAVTSLSETFAGCMDPVFGVFKASSEVGGQNWRCTIFGHNDSIAVHMNGFAGGPKDNIDWLVSPALDMTAMTNPHLNFWSRLRFPDNNQKELYISTNYTGLGSPAAATWQQIQINNWSSLDTNWQQFTGVDLTQYKGSTFYIAFKYTSDTSAADDWYLDDIEIIEGPNAVVNFSAEELAVKVLGGVSDILNIQSVSSKERKLKFAVVDMAGRVITKGPLDIYKGRQQHGINVSKLSGGMYFLQLVGDRSVATVKFIVR